MTRLYTNHYGPIKNTQIFYIKLFFIYFGLMVITSSYFNQNLDFFYLITVQFQVNEVLFFNCRILIYLMEFCLLDSWQFLNDISAWTYKYSNLINQSFLIDWKASGVKIKYVLTLKSLWKIAQDQAMYLAALLQLQEVMDINTLMNLGKKAGINVFPVDWYKFLLIFSVLCFSIFYWHFYNWFWKLMMISKIFLICAQILAQSL